jgi:hypothetical protein
MAITSSKWITLVALVMMMCSGRATASHEDSAIAFERLKKLSGTWEVVVESNARRSFITYVMTGRGTVLIEEFRSGGVGGMMTAYHLDKGTLVLTHFCGAGNQPRMRIKGVQDGGKRIRFEMYDITNLADPQAYHSTALDVVFIGDDRVDLAYEGMRAGVKSTQTFRLTRKTSTVAATAQAPGAAAAAKVPAPSGVDSKSAFIRLKGLVGTWDVTERDRPTTKEIATYSMTSSGSVLTEDLRAPAGSTEYEMGHMYTTYHLDKGQLVLTLSVARAISPGCG